MRHDLRGYRLLLEKAARHFRGDDDGWARFVAHLPPRVVERLREDWWWQAHGGQWMPGSFATGLRNVWLLMAGRGFGKTRAGAEWVHAVARGEGAVSGVRPTHELRQHRLGNEARSSSSLPGRGEGVRIALVGASMDEVAKVMIEGPSGLIALARAGEPVAWAPTRGELRFASGAVAFPYSAGAAEGLRGPEHHFAWCDELAKWRPSTGSGRGGADAAWDNLMMGLRLGEHPRAMVTTTPRPVPLLRRLLATEGVALTRGRTVDNLHLPAAFTRGMEAIYAGTRLGRQELDGELIDDVEGSLFPRRVLEAARVEQLGTSLLGVPNCGSEAGTRNSMSPVPRLKRVVVGVDPPASQSGACGIVVCAEGAAGVLYVLADCSVAGLRPEGWARAVARAAEAWGADRVVAEVNQGGDMVEHVLRSVDCMLPVKKVHASRGKAARAEPVAALFEAGRIKLAGAFPELEDELSGMTIGGDYEGPGTSPDRADACVWACHALIRRGGEPRIFAF